MCCCNGAECSKPYIWSLSALTNPVQYPNRCPMTTVLSPGAGWLWKSVEGPRTNYAMYILSRASGNQLQTQLTLYVPYTTSLRHVYKARLGPTAQAVSRVFQLLLACAAMQMLSTSTLISQNIVETPKTLKEAWPVWAWFGGPDFRLRAPRNLERLSGFRGSAQSLKPVA